MTLKNNDCEVLKAIITLKYTTITISNIQIAF